MKRVVNIILIVISFLSFSCSKEKSELSILEPKIKANDTAWCVHIEDIFGTYAFANYIRSDNKIYQFLL